MNLLLVSGGGGGGGDGGLNTKKINKMILISIECTNYQVARNIYVGIKSKTQSK